MKWLKLLWQIRSQFFKTEDMNELEPLQEKGLQIKKLTDQITEYLAALFSPERDDRAAGRTDGKPYVHLKRCGNVWETLSVEVAKCTGKIENRYKYTPKRWKSCRKA